MEGITTQLKFSWFYQINYYVMNIELLYPDIIVQVWEDRYPMERNWDTYTVKQQLIQDVEADNIMFYIWDELFDVEDRRIALGSGDILHIEYILKCLHENGWSDIDQSTTS